MTLRVLGGIAVLLCLQLVCGAGDTLVLRQTIALPGVEGRFDHATADPSTHRLFFAALGNNSLEVVDVRTGTRVHTISGLKKPTGVAFLPDTNLLVVANGDDGTCRFYDAKSYEEKGRIAGLEDADNVRFDGRAKRLYLGYGEGALAVIDPAGMKLIKSIALPKHPESFQLEANGPRIFVNVPDAQQIAVVDREVGKVIGTWLETEYRANFPMALDEKRQRLYIGCRQPARLLAFDCQTGKRTSDSELDADTDDIFLDGRSGRLIAACGQGSLDIFQLTSPGGLKRVGTSPTAPGARTCYWIQELACLAVAVPHRGAQGAEIRLYRWESDRE